MTQTETEDQVAGGAKLSTDIVIPDPTGAMVPLTPELVKAWLDGDDIAEYDDTDELDYATAVKILGAADQAEALQQDDVREFKSLVDSSFAVISVTWRKSTKSEDGRGRYALMRCADSDGVGFITSTGATKIVLQLRKAQLEGWFPWAVSVLATTTSNNRTVYELTAPGEAF